MKINNCVVVFDLDDTLFSEYEYFLSGISFIEDFISNYLNRSFKGKILNAHKSGIKDLWEWTCLELDLPKEIKNSLIWQYRLHIPNIYLPLEIKKLIYNLQKYGANIAILTDGRSVTQRIKVKKLNLESIPIFISEEFNSKKPELKRFEYVEKLWEKKNYIYIGDNPAKDFEAPLKLNWLTIGADWIKPRLYKKNKALKNSQPHVWLDDPIKVIEFLINWE